MPVQTTYYCVKSVTEIAKLAVEYRKIQEINKLIPELERQKMISESIMSYTRLIKEEVQSLMHVYFKSAYENLNYALNASGENRQNYLQQAKNRFIDAITIEKNENLILSYLGLSFLQALTDDYENCQLTLKKVENVFCYLSNDYNDLYSMFPYNECWDKFFYSLMMELGGGHMSGRCINFTSVWNCFAHWNSFMFGYYAEREKGFQFIQDMKTYFYRRMKYLIEGGDFWDGERLIQNDKQAIKRILQEDFDKFKKEVLLQFNL